MQEGVIPEKGKERYWILDDILVKKGYNLIEIENMEADEYDFRIALAVAKPETKNNPFTGI